MHVYESAVLRIRVVAEADPGALVRTPQFLQARNLVPRGVTSQRLGNEYLEIGIEIDTADCTIETLSLVIAKLNELPIVVAAVACE